MASSMNVSYYIIGNDSLLTQCLEILRYYKQAVLGAYAKDPKIQSWIKDHDFVAFNSIHSLAQQATTTNCDYLIVLDHSMEIPSDLVKTAKTAVIIFRNTLLNCDRESAAAQLIWGNCSLNSIVWYVECKRKASIKVLRKHDIAIDEHETALTLNLKIYESAVITFRDLIQELLMNKCHKTYWLELIVVDGACEVIQSPKLIDWRNSAYEIYRLYRSLQFGAYTNRIGLVTFLVGDVALVPNEIRVVRRNFHCKVGLITAIASNYLQVSTARDDIRIYSVSDLSGRIWSIQEIVQHFKLIEGCLFSKPFQAGTGAFQQLVRKIYVNEEFWVNYLSQITRAQLIPCVTNREMFANDKLQEKQDIGPSNKIIERLKDIFNISARELWLAIILLYLYRMNDAKKFSVKLYGVFPPLKKIAQYVCSSSIIFICDFSEFETFSEILLYIKEQLDTLKQHGPYRHDLFLRNPSLLEKLRLLQGGIYLDHGPVSQENLSAEEKCYSFIVQKSMVQFKYLASFLSDSRNQAILLDVGSHITALMENLAYDPDRPICSLSLLNKTKLHQIMKKWNNTFKPYPKQKLLHELFEQQVEATPTNIAAVFMNQQLTYQELNKRANQLARHLQKIGVQVGDFIAVILERSLNVIISILAILKVGGAYVPIAPDYPKDRIQYILANNCSWAIVDASVTTSVINYVKELVKVISLQHDFSVAIDEDTANLTPAINAQGLAYVLYTSGTTGWPKGVQISHQALVNHMFWMQEEFDFNSTDIVLQKTPFTFDAAVWEIFMPILVGGKLVFAPQFVQSSPFGMIKELQEHKVTTLQLVPSILRELLKLDELKACSSLRQIFSGGELLSSDIKQQFFNMFSGVELHNLYGPTEATIEVTSHTCINSAEDISMNIIGKPISNTRLYILDRNLEIVPAGVLGELYISGDCLSMGYVNNTELTQEKFIPNKFVHDQAAKLYKTGDLVRWLPDGNIEIIGRTDSQVKVRGFRIELAEIENNILLHKDIRQCAVVARQDGLGFAFLVAYVKSCNKKDVDGDTIKTFLKQKLPEYMIPSMFIFLERFPLTAHEKVDKKNLPSPDMEKMRHSSGYVQPTTPSEIKLAKIWQGILEISRIGAEDDFFSLGGHSLSVLQLLAHIENAFNVQIGMQDFVNNSTIANLSKFILARKRAEQELGIKASRQGITKILSPIVTLRKGGSKNPLFLIHPVGGTIFWYILLSKFLNVDHPICAIQDIGLINKTIKISSIEDMASFYLKVIKEVQPSGPYFIGGASFGSTVAIEIAKQLAACNEETSFIPLFDGWAVYPDTLLDPEIFEEIMERQHTALRAKFNLNGIAANAKDLLSLQQSRINMLWRYKMDKITHHLTLFKAQELLPIFKAIDSPYNHWDNYAVNPVDVHIVPGNHETMFQDPHIRFLVDRLVKNLTSC